MHATFTNSKPEVIVAYFIDAVTELGGCPKILRSDWYRECACQRITVFFALK